MPLSDVRQPALRRTSASLVLSAGLLLPTPAPAAAPPEPARPNPWAPSVAAFGADLDALRRPLAIPGLAYAVVHDGQLVAKGALGHADDARTRPFTTATPLRIASVTKALTALVVLKQVEAGALSLDTPVKRHLPGFDGPETVTLRHLLTHTSEGEPGAEYVYGSSRYARVGELLRAVTGRAFEPLLREGVLEPAGMRWHDSPALAAHGGLVSTVDDMAKLLESLDAGRVLARQGLARLEAPSRANDGRPLPVSLGWFAQDVQGERVVWSFGQDDPERSAALLLPVPARRWSLFALANRDTLNDAFRLLMGDVRKSPVATSFLRTFVFSPAGRPLPGLGVGPPDELVARAAGHESHGPCRYVDELLGRAMTLRWAGDDASAERLLFMTLDRYGLRDVPDPVLHFLALRLGTPASRSWGIAQGEGLLKEHPANRWILFTQANLLSGDPARSREAVDLYQAVLDLPNQAPDFLHRLLRAWCLTGIARVVRGRHPEQAERRLAEVIDLKVGGDTEAEARRLLAEWRGAAQPK